jgi:hypothetical protein
MSDTDAWPFAPVVAGFGVVNVALGPLPGAANVTDTPLTAAPLESFTTTTSGIANPVANIAFCPDPETTDTENGVPAVLISENVAGVTIPAAFAVTL